MPQFMIQAVVDELLLDFGRYEPLELLQREGRLLYADYEAWRGGEVESLDDLLMGAADAIKQQLQLAAAYAGSLGLVAQTEDYSGWGQADGERLKLHSDPVMNQMLGQVWRPAEDRPQLDLFMDSPAVSLGNGIREALVNRDPQTAARLLEQLYDVDAGYAELASLERLVAAQQHLSEPVTDIEAELAMLRDEIAPMANTLLKSRARDLLAPMWRRLSESLRGQPFNAAQPEYHSSYTAAQAGDWPLVRETVEAEPDWQSEPLLLGRHIEACRRTNDELASQTSCLRLCWQFPEQAGSILKSAPSALMRNEWAAFQELDPPLPTEKFPAWLLIQYPALSISLPRAFEDIDANVCHEYQLLHQLQSQPGELDDIHIAMRKALKESNPALFEQYMARSR